MSFENLQYIPGFGSHVCTEALPGALPEGQNSPQICPYGLYAEQLSGTAFTAPRHKNLRTWQYRIRPSVIHNRMVACEDQTLLNDWENLEINPSQFRWDPYDYPTNEETVDFVNGLKLIAGAGDPSVKDGIATYQYIVNASMENKAFYSADGDFLIVPQEGVLNITTEMGKMVVAPEEICVIPRGVRFQVKLAGEKARGYVAELFKGHFELPSLGPIGANGLANPRDFQTPVAAFEDDDSDWLVVGKFLNKMYSATLNHSPFDVVAWHGNYAPYKYNLRLFNTINTVSFDHPDPSIFTVLTAPTDEAGTAALDFVIFPHRWMVGENTFRPPYYHRNCMSEYMGMICGHYDGKLNEVSNADKPKGGFLPGGSSLHSCMTAHGPDAKAFESASKADLKPVKFEGGLAFMFESSYILKVSQAAVNTPHLQAEYVKCWHELPKLFNGTKDVSI